MAAGNRSSVKFVASGSRLRAILRFIVAFTLESDRTGHTAPCCLVDVSVMDANASHVRRVVLEHVHSLQL